MKQHQSQINLKALPYIILLGSMFGSNMVAARFALGQMEPNVFNSLRLILVNLIFVGLITFSPKQQWPRDKKLWLHAGIWGVIGLAVPMASFISALKYQSSGVNALLITLQVATTSILAHFILHDEAFNAKKILGVIIAFAGAGLILVQGETGLAELSKADWRGYALVGVGVIGSSTGLIYARKFLKNNGHFEVLPIRMLAAALVLIPFTGVTVGFDLSGIQWSGVLVLLFSAVIGTFFTFQVEFHIVKRFGASATSQSSYVVPVIATALGALLLGEQITLTILLGMVIIFVGITLLNR